MVTSSAAPGPSDERRATLLLLDGARGDVFLRLAADGDLPNLSRYVLDPGGVVPATTVFPSTTGVAYLPFLTGCYPGTCDVPGIRWLDRRTYRGRWWSDREHVRSYCGYQADRLNGDVRPNLASLFDRVDDVAVLASPFTRGLDGRANRVRVARALLGSVAHYTGRYGSLDRAVGRELARVAANRHRLVFAVFPAVDGVTHFHDPWHPAVLATYRQFDGIVGDYASRGGFDGDHLALIVSDHGASPVERHTDIAAAMDDMGVRTLRHPVLWRRDAEAAVMVSGNGSAQVYVAPTDGQADRVSLSDIEAGSVKGIPSDLVDRLAALDGVAFVAAAEGSGMALVGRNGRAYLAPDPAGQITYRTDGADVLDLDDGGTRSEREWLNFSLDRRYPDAPTQLLQLFRSERAGDLVVVAEHGSDLRDGWEVPEHRSGHGSLIAEHMRCLIASNRPMQSPMRTVDVFPMLLAHLDCDVPPGIDGIWAASATD
ncbi:MAG: alkaline phosphatase family protein [Gemmatimonadota bacterium]